MSRRLITAAVIILVMLQGCAAEAPRPSLVVPRPSSDERRPEERGLGRVMGHAAIPLGVLAAVSRIRGLPWKHSVPSLTLARQELLARVKEHVRREVPPEAIRAEGLVQKMLGLFPTNEDYEAATYALLLGQLAGYYEPEDGTMYLADDLDVANQSGTLSHELVHALQDQHWDLRSLSRYVAGEDDKDSAFSALAEGDATSAMEDELLTRARPERTALDLPDLTLEQSLVRSIDAGPAASAPHALQMALVAPYVDGTRFVNALRREGGWLRVDEAWAHLPVTTEQVLHPDKWRVHEPAIPLPTPPPPSPDFVLVMESTYGEQAIRLMLGEWVTARLACAAASGWGGDRGALYVRGDRDYAFAWHLRFDDASPAPAGAFASRFFRTLTAALPRLGGAAAPGCVERGGNGVLAVKEDGRDVYLVFGTTRTGGSGWRPVMACPEAGRWNEEVRSAGQGPPPPG